MLAYHTLPVLAVFCQNCFAIWPGPYSVHHSYHEHFAIFDETDEDLEMVHSNVTDPDAEWFDLDTELGVTTDDRDLNAWYPTDYDQRENVPRKRQAGSGEQNVSQAETNDTLLEDKTVEEMDYDYASLRRDYDVQAVVIEDQTPGQESIATVKGKESHGMKWPTLNWRRLLLAALGLYLLLVVPCYCSKGWCCCCFFWVPLCQPRDVIREAKRYATQNPPGVIHKEPVPNEPDVNETEDGDDVEDKKLARIQAIQEANDCVEHYQTTPGEKEAYDELMHALRGL